MKKTVLFITMTVSVLLFGLPNTKALTLSDDVEVIEIDISYHLPENGPKRNPILIPINALYYVTFSYIDVSFTSNIGDVTITLTNQTTGGSTSMQSNSGFGGCLVPVTLGSGFYRISFVAQDGASYEGYFTVF